MALALPRPLVPGDWIRVLAPASPCLHDELWQGLAWLRARYRLRLNPNALQAQGFLAGDDSRRADELTTGLLEGETKAVVALRGGYGAMRILEGQPWEAFARQPKWIVGFSDITALHTMAWKCGVASVHGPNVVGLGANTHPAIRAAWIAALERPRSSHRWAGLRVVHSGSGEGPIVGGNLSLLHAMAAAGLLQIRPGAVLAIEDIGEAPYRVDRMLTSLLLGGHFASLSAIVCGGFDRCAPREDGYSVEQVLQERTAGLRIPVMSGAPFGHGPRNEAFVFGSVARVQDGCVTLCG